MPNKQRGTIARSPGVTLRDRMSASPIFTRQAEKLDERLIAVCGRALRAATARRAGERVAMEDDLSATGENELKAASIGSLGCSLEVARRCGEALAEWEAALRERAQR